MADHPLDPNALDAAASLITERRDILVSERATLIAERTEILTRLRRIERELSDCRAAARLFGLAIEFPPDEQEAERNARDRVRAELEREMELRRQRNAAMHPPLPHAPLPQPAARPLVAPPAETSLAPSAPAPKPRPPLREILVDQLKIAGEKGAKATALRDYVERVYGLVTHEKTIGMTLYRLSQDKLVRRDGHVWFFGPPLEAETKNPGVGAPGSETSAK